MVGERHLQDYYYIETRSNHIYNISKLVTQLEKQRDSVIGAYYKMDSSADKSIIIKAKFSTGTKTVDQIRDIIQVAPFASFKMAKSCCESNRCEDP